MNKQLGKAEGASCPHERSRGLDERPNMRKKPFGARISPGRPPGSGKETK